MDLTLNSSKSTKLLFRYIYDRDAFNEICEITDFDLDIFKNRVEPTIIKPKLSVQIKDTIVIIIIRYKLSKLKRLIFPYSVRSVYF